MRTPTVTDEDGTLVVHWPDPKPASFEITADAFEALIDTLNARAQRLLAPTRTNTEQDTDPRLHSWDDGKRRDIKLPSAAQLAARIGTVRVPIVGTWTKPPQRRRWWQRRRPTP